MLMTNDEGEDLAEMNITVTVESNNSDSDAAVSAAEDPDMS